MTFTIPKEFKDLPVARKLDHIDPTQNFILVAHTGSGKTMVIAPWLNFKTGRKILMRQPTRVATRSAFETLKEFWGPLGFKIGMMTSEETVGDIDENDITVVTDGEMTHILKEPEHKFTCIFDEVHSQMAATEIEMGIVKTYMNQGKDIRIVFLSATIRPENILNHFESLNKNPQTKEYIRNICDLLEQGEIVNTVDQKQFLKAYYTEGVTFPIEKRILHPMSIESTPEIDFAHKMVKENKRGLIFVCTRNQAADLAGEIMHREICPALEVNADIDARSIKKFVEEHQPCVVASTVALATSITLPFDEVLIMDKGIDSVFEDGLKKTLNDIPLDDNGILQRAGRVGRVKPGVAILCSSHTVEVKLADRVERVPLRTSWDVIRPTMIKPPLEKIPPDNVVLTCASYGMDPRELDVLSRLDQAEIEKSIVRLARWGLIEKNGYLKITQKGRRVFAMPLEINLAVMIVDCPHDILPAILAIASMGEGVYHLFQQAIYKVINGHKEKIRGIALLEEDMKDPDSVLITKVKILQNYFHLRSEGNGVAANWADENGLLIKKLERIAYQWLNIIDKGLHSSESVMRHKLIGMDINEKKSEILSYINRINLYDRTILEWIERKKYYQGSWAGRWMILSADDAFLMSTQDNPMSGRSNAIEVLGTPRILKKKDGSGEYAFWGDTTVVALLSEWEDRNGEGSY